MGIRMFGFSKHTIVASHFNCCIVSMLPAQRRSFWFEKKEEEEELSSSATIIVLFSKYDSFVRTNWIDTCLWSIQTVCRKTTVFFIKVEIVSSVTTKRYDKSLIRKRSQWEYVSPHRVGQETKLIWIDNGWCEIYHSHANKYPVIMELLSCANIVS